MTQRHWRSRCSWYGRCMPFRSPSTAGPAPYWAVQAYRQTATRTASARPARRSRRRSPRSSPQTRRRWRSQDWRLSRRGRAAAPCMQSCGGSTSSGRRAHRWARCRSVFTHVWSGRKGAGQSRGKGGMLNARGGVLVQPQPTSPSETMLSFTLSHLQLSPNSSRPQKQASFSLSCLASRPAHFLSCNLPGLRRS